MYDRVRARKQSLKQVLISYVASDTFEGRVARQRIVSEQEEIDHTDSPTQGEKLGDQHRANIARPAGHQDCSAHSAPSKTVFAGAVTRGMASLPRTRTRHHRRQITHSALNTFGTLTALERPYVRFW